MLTITNLYKSVPGRMQPVLKNINLRLKPGDFCVLIGSNGSGKSTLMKIICGESIPDTGKVMLYQHEANHRDKCQGIACVTQDVNTGTVAELTLLENMVLSSGRTKKSVFSLYHRRADKVIAAIKALGLGLESYLHTPLGALSGGQRQMVATVMALSANPQLLLLDEHTSALDPSAQRLVMAYTARAIAKQQLTSLMITHHLEDALRYGTRLIMLHQGHIVLDVSGEAKKALSTASLLALFHRYQDTLLGEEAL